jgi:hypothetical protein
MNPLLENLTEQAFEDLAAYDALEAAPLDAGKDADIKAWFLRAAKWAQSHKTPMACQMDAKRFQSAAGNRSHTADPETKNIEITKDQLIMAAMLAEEHDFNRQLITESLRELPDRSYPITHIFPHHHRGGEECEEHRRLFVSLPPVGPDDEKWSLAAVDVPIAFVDRLLRSQ